VSAPGPKDRSPRRGLPIFYPLPSGERIEVRGKEECEISLKQFHLLFS